MECSRGPGRECRRAGTGRGGGAGAQATPAAAGIAPRGPKEARAPLLVCKRGQGLKTQLTKWGNSWGTPLLKKLVLDPPSALPSAPEPPRSGTHLPLRCCVCHQGELDQSLPPALKPAQIPCAVHHPRSCPRTPLGDVQRETSVPVSQTHPPTQAEPKSSRVAGGTWVTLQRQQPATLPPFLDKQSLR